MISATTTSPSYLSRLATFPFIMLVCAALLIAFTATVNAQAGVTIVDDCTEDGLNAAINAIPASGADLMLDCPANTTITITGQKTIAAPMGLFAAEHVTLAGDGRTRLFYVRPNGALTLENLTLANGFGNYGGAVYVQGALDARQVTFSGNRALDYGGAVYTDRGVASIAESRFEGNSAAEGGALFVDFQSTVTLADSIVDDNSARYGGGVAVGYRGDLSIVDSVISNNQARLLGDGGGIYVDDRGRLTLARSTVQGNNATYGGGIDVEERAFVEMTDSTVSGNTAREGGGMSISDGVVSLGNTTISGNSADLGGGGIYLDSAGATLTHVTVANNEVRLARQAAGIYAEGRSVLELHNTVLDNPGAANCYFGGRASLTIVTASASTDRSCGTRNVEVVAASGLAPLAANGGPTETHLPDVQSPLIDAGETVSDVTTDQRGETRPSGDATDIGAVERQADD